MKGIVLSKKSRIKIMSENPVGTPNSNDNDPPKIKLKAAEKKSDTARIDLASAKPPPSIVDKSLLPVDADDYFKRSTIRIDVPPSTSSGAPATSKSDTTRIEINNAAPADEVFTSKTIPVGVPVTPPPQSGRPKTITMKRPVAAPGESIIVAPDVTATATEQARKSETARIDLSAEELDRPATRPKTIRIKRPDGTSGRKPLTISRPEGSEAVSIASEPVADLGGEEDAPGMLVNISAIAALIVAGVLVYLLIGQTLAPTLPLPGRIL